MVWQWNFGRLRSKVSLPIAQNAEPAEDGLAGVDDGEVDAAIDLRQHPDESLDREALRAAVTKIGHAPFVDAEQVGGDDGREVIDESQYLVGELLAERGDRRFDGIAGHAAESGLMSPTGVIGGLPSGARVCKATSRQIWRCRLPRSLHTASRQIWREA